MPSLTTSRPVAQRDTYGSGQQIADKASTCAVLISLGEEKHEVKTSSKKWHEAKNLRYKSMRRREHRARREVRSKDETRITSDLLWHVVSYMHAMTASQASSLNPCVTSANRSISQLRTGGTCTQAWRQSSPCYFRVNRFFLIITRLHWRKICPWYTIYILCRWGIQPAMSRMFSVYRIASFERWDGY